MSRNDPPFVCPDPGVCHSGDFADFDHFCDALKVNNDELPQAFAAWLGRRFNWDGNYQEVS